MRDTNLAYHTPHWSGGCGIGNLVRTMARFFNISKHTEINQRTCSAHLNLSDMLRKLASRRNNMTVQKQETSEISATKHHPQKPYSASESIERPGHAYMFLVNADPVLFHRSSSVQLVSTSGS